MFPKKKQREYSYTEDVVKFGVFRHDSGLRLSGEIYQLDS
jgi:hypothetical protein